MKAIMMRLARQKAQQKGVNPMDTSTGPSRVSSPITTDSPLSIPLLTIVPLTSPAVLLVLPLLSPITSLVLTLENSPSPEGILDPRSPSPSPSLAEESAPIPNTSLPLLTIVPPTSPVVLLVLPLLSPITSPILTLENPTPPMRILNPNPLFPAFAFTEESSLILSDLPPYAPLFPCVISSSPSPVISPPASPVSFSPYCPPTEILSSPPKNLPPGLMEMTIGPNEAPHFLTRSVGQPLWLCPLLLPYPRGIYKFLIRRNCNPG